MLVLAAVNAPAAWFARSVERIAPVDFSDPAGEP
jgi:hypothetical protein